MTGSVALDVVIGLVFIYLLYSLFATVIMEIINSFLGLRARNLRYALRRMLMNERHAKWFDNKIEDSYWLSFFKNLINLIPRAFLKIWNTFLKFSGRSGNLKDPELFHLFYNQPIIKYLGGGGIANKPSYMSPKNFSKALVDSLNSDISIVVLFKKFGVDTNLLKQEFILLDETSVFMKAYNEIEDESKTFEGWFEKRTDIEKLGIASEVFPNNIGLKRNLNAMQQLINGGEVKRRQPLEQLFEDASFDAKIKAGLALLPKESDTRKHIESLLTDADTKVDEFKLLLEQWFNDTMERSTGWFKRRVQYILFIVGFVLAVSFNADTINIVKKLSKDPDARAELVELAVEYSNDFQEVKQIPKPDEDKGEENKEINNPAHDAINKSPTVEEDERFQEVRDSLINVAKVINDDIYSAQNIIGTNWKIPEQLSVVNSLDSLKKDAVRFDYPLKVIKKTYLFGLFKKCDTIDVYLEANKSADTIHLKNAILPVTKEDFDKREIPVNSAYYKLSYVFFSKGFYKNLWGYILTALAISLGSPFWFDVLNKLIKLRSSLQHEKPNPKKQTPN
ncbi:hypothetical protein [Jejuia spongiicola]|uniref:Uncharacterized protein n=1 Tax=Jejuia spongiicola TaxID=2942207 RepID=A0ABT0QD37_9FLAO|nr:hypothetical protein [Jejuia spongiicola]MCL6294866.1 hypothetical protein [Jejuia spongiicola]